MNFSVKNKPVSTLLEAVQQAYVGGTLQFTQDGETIDVPSPQTTGSMQQQRSYIASVCDSVEKGKYVITNNYLRPLTEAEITELVLN
tara:strand:+ start:322 stop:582 length:261 start_codon:yes stop_codon:yes gene_type:complete